MGDSSKTSERDAEGERVELNYDEETSKGEKAVKVICLGDSAVGKSKLVERYLVDGFTPQRLSTYGQCCFFGVFSAIPPSESPKF